MEITLKSKSFYWNILFVASVVFLLSPFGSVQASLAIGIVISIFLDNPYLGLCSRFSKFLIQSSIVFLGLTMNLEEVLRVGLDTFTLTLISIVTTLVLGRVFAAVFSVPTEVARLISVGTAICGGSAIAAVGSVLMVSETTMSLSIACVFIFNAVALYFLPHLGELLSMSQQTFGVWAGVSIHDISSVVGAASVFGPESLQIATTVKLSRTLWIVPLCIFYSFSSKSAAGSATGSERVQNKRNNASRLPIFIVLYLLASGYRTMSLPLFFSDASILAVSKLGFTLALLLVGLSTSTSKISGLASSSVALAASLWISVLLLSYWLIV